MELYICLLIAIIVVGIYTDRELLHIQQQTILSPKLYLVAFSFLLFFLSAMRVQIGTDYDLYRQIYTYAEERELELSFLYTWMSNEFRALGFSYQTFIAAHAFIFMSSIYTFIRTNSTYYYISLVSLLGTYMYFTSFNTFRQMTAAAFVIVALLCFCHFRKTLPTILFYAIAIGFHKSTIMYLPIFLFRFMQLSKKLYIAILVISGVAYFLLPSSLKAAAFDVVLQQSEFFKEKYDGTIFIEGEERGITNKVFFLFYTFILGRLVLSTSFFNEGSWIERTFLFYIVIQAFLPISNVTDRMTIVFELLAICLLPRFIQTFQQGLPRTLVKFAVLSIYSVRMIYVLALNGDGVVPYTSIFS